MPNIIPFVERALPAAETEAPVIVREMLARAVEAEPELRASRMIAKKGVATWSEVGKASILPLEERVDHTRKIVDRFMDTKWLDELTQAVKSNLGDKKKVSVVFTRAYEGGTLNLIPPAMAAKVQAHLARELPGIDVSINKDLFQASKANRTTADSAATLLSRQQIFEGNVERDAAHVLLDEHIEAGATLRGLDNYIRREGGHVAAIATLTRNPGSEHLRILPQTLEAIERALDEKAANMAIHGKSTEALLASKGTAQKELLARTLAGLGLKPETLTNSEGLAVVAHLTQDKASFNTLLNAAGTNIDEYAKHGADYVVKLLDLPPEQKTVEALAAAISKDLGEHYQYLGMQPQQAAQ